MADIVDFRGASKRPTPSRTGHSTSAEIVIFPGVRYERIEDCASEAATMEPKHRSAKKARKKRDMLELVDA